MKQYISISQLNELSEKAKVTLREWFWGESANAAYYGNPDECVADGMTIGKMIEFLDEHGGISTINSGIDWEIWLEDNPTGTAYMDNELCDALWEAVKEVLEDK